VPRSPQFLRAIGAKVPRPGSRHLPEQSGEGNGKESLDDTAEIPVVGEADEKTLLVDVVEREVPQDVDEGEVPQDVDEGEVPEDVDEREAPQDVDEEEPLEGVDEEGSLQDFEQHEPLEDLDQQESRPQEEPAEEKQRRFRRWSELGERRRARLRRTLVGLGVLLLLAAGGLTFVATQGSGKSQPRADKPSTASATHGHSRVSAVKTFLGSDGVESSAIIAENKLPGTTAWQIANTPPTGYIDGFANLNYAAVGQTVGLYVSTTAPQFHVVAYRMGWYQGKGAREIWSSAEMSGTVQPPCPVTSGINMVSCDNWSLSLNVPITSAFMQGDYLFKLVGSTNVQSYVLMTIWDPDSTAAYLFMSRSLTEEGWNTYGGYSYYQGEGPCTLGQTGSYPVCNRARVVSFDRPYADGDGASDFLSNEYPLIQFMEEHGLDVAYVTDITVDEHPSITLQHRALLSLGHDETWTYNERQAAQTALDHGVNVVFFGAAAVLRHSRLQASPLGPDREEVDYRDETADPLNGNGNPMEVTGNTWSSPPSNWPETSFVGEVYAGYLNSGSVPFVVEDSSAWIFKGTGLQNGSSVAGVVESDIDNVDSSQDTPSNLEVLGHSPVPLTEATSSLTGWAGNTYSDMTYYTDPQSQGGVFDSGTVNWINSLSPCPTTAATCPATAVGQITGNLLWLFGQGPAGHLDPSTSNAQSVSPSGS
jgi:hypothetical protein